MMQFPEPGDRSEQGTGWRRLVFRRESSWITCVCDVQIRPEAVYSWLMCSLLSCSQETYPLMSCKLFDKVTNSFTNIQTAVSFLITEHLRDLSAASKIEKQHQMKYHTVQWLASWKCLFWSSVNFNWQIRNEFLENSVTWLAKQIKLICKHDKTYTNWEIWYICHTQSNCISLFKGDTKKDIPNKKVHIFFEIPFKPKEYLEIYF